jgi:photosystem II stability/assembly factor-like uncharacterized protein
METERKSSLTKSTLAEKFTTLLFYASLLLFFVAFNFRDNPGGWQLQNITNLNGTIIQDVTFTDSLTGYLATGLNNQLGYIMKTTNGGVNWIIKKTNVYNFQRIIFCDKYIGYSNSYDTLFKTTNRGENWFAIAFPDIFADDMFALNKDTLWVVMNETLTGGVFRSTNGGLSWIHQINLGSNPDKIYMVNKNLGFIRRGEAPFGGYIGRTTDGGFNWTLNTNVDTTFSDMYFLDSLTGYKCDLNIQKTTDGGLTWTWQVLPHLNYANIMSRFSFINKDTIFGIGGIYSYPSTDRGLVYKTTNGGINWGYQIPDTSFGIYSLWYIDFVNKMKGWAFRPNSKNIYTTTGGGDTTLYTNIKEQITNIASDYVLYQNYPNPFNSMTNVKVQMLKQGFAEIKVFDISGKLIKTLLKQNLYSGELKVSFYASDLTSGVYFYTLFVDGVRIDTKKMALIK